jgi:hypothetical protein
LGFGTVAYFDFHRYLMILYAIIVFVLLPSLGLFLFYGDGRRIGSTFFTKFTIGNLGFSSALCKDVTLAVGNLTLTCPTAEIRNIVSFGIIPADGKVNDACLPNTETKEWDHIFDHTHVKQQIENRCMGKPFCTINVAKLFKRKGPDKWINDYAQFYTQVFWEHADDEIDDRNWLSIWFWVQIILTTFAFIGFLYFLRRRTEKEYTFWDIWTTTVSDYTMNYRIPEKIFKEFKETIYPIQRKQLEKRDNDSSSFMQKMSRDNSTPEKSEHIPDSWIYAFKKYLKNEFENILKNTEHVRFDDNNLIRIAHIHLGFDHSHLHTLLAKRGAAIKDNNHSKKDKIEKEIKEYVHTKSEELCTPRDAYIIFETEEAVHRAMKFNSYLKCGKEMATHEWKGTNLIIENVKEPTNISFENKYKNYVRTIIKLAIVGIILVASLTLTCYLIFFFQDRVNRLNRQYPQVNWDIVIADSNPEMMKDYAFLEFYNYETSDKSDETILKQNTDNLQWYWDQLVDQIGYLDAYNKEFNVKVLNKKISGKVCNDYLQSAVFIKAIAVLLPLLIIIFNVLLKTLAIILVKWLSFENKTIEISIIQSVVFLLMFFNSAIAILLINANIEELNSKSGVLFNGLYSDFSDDWYDKISMFFITPMFAQLIFPVTAFLPGFIIQKLLAWFDRRFTDKKLYKTTSNLAYDYADANSGTEHLLYEKYPRLLNIIFVSSFYGFSLPLLPILIFISLIISYVIDKIVVALYHRKPPLYDNTLNVVSIHFLKWAAFLYIAIAYWVITNKQLFGNRLTPIEYQAQVEFYGHYIFEMPDTPQETVVLAVAMLILLYWLVNLVYHIISPLFRTTSQEELMEFEDLKPFYEALDFLDLEFWVTEERQIRNKFKYKYLFDDLYDKLQKRYKEVWVSFDSDF